MKQGKRVNVKRIFALLMAVFMLVTSVTIFPTTVEAATVTKEASTVKAKSITLNHSAYTLKKGKTVKLKATISPKKAKNKTIVWKSSKKSVATVNSKGVVKGIKNGTATITATVKGTKVKATCKISVGTPVTKVTVPKKSISLEVGKTYTIKPTITPKKATNKGVTYTSSKKSVATVNSKGKITAKKVGTAKITVKAKDGSNKKATVTVKVTPILVKNIKITAAKTNIVIGEKTKATAEIIPTKAANKKLKWSSSNKSVATVSADGTITGVGAGTATIKANAQDGSKTTGTIKITVDAVKVEETVLVSSVAVTADKTALEVGETAQASVTVLPTNAGNKNVTWASSDANVATVDAATGFITAKNPGTVTITATAQDGSGKSGSVQLTVKNIPVQSVSIDLTEVKLNVNETKQLTAKVLPENATNKKLTWTSANADVAVVDQTGLVTAKQSGETTITVTTEDGSKTAVCTVKVENTMSANSYAELESILSGKLPEKIVLNTAESGEYTISAGDYSNTILIVNAPNATITNNASFRKVEIQSISKDTWIEKATGNTIDIVASEAHVVVDGQNTAIMVNPGVAKVEIETNGTVENITVATNAEVSIKGTNHAEVPVDVQAGGSVIKTSVPVAIEATQNVTLQMKPGAENSKISIENETVEAVVQGIGTIPVTNKETGAVTDVVAENIVIEDDEETEVITGSITGMVCNVESQAVQGAVVYVIPYTSTFDQNDIEAAIEAAENQERCYITNTNESGSYTVNNLPYGNYVLIVKADNLRNYFQTTVLNQGNVTNTTITMVEKTDETGNVKGTLYDAFNASPVASGINLYLRKGANNTTGDVVAQTVTNDQGGYSFTELESGTYTVQVVDNRTDVEQRYIRMSFNVVVLSGVDVVANMTISKAVEGDQIRFVLTWGAQSEDIDVPSDLDSHLIGPSTISGEKFHVYYSYRDYYENDVKYADLDVDDTDYEGPETTTIYKPVDGVYHFYIYDFSNQSYRESMGLANSQAMVKVYIGDRNIATYNVPNSKGTLWDVCTYDVRTNTLTPVNTVYYHPGDSSNVGKDMTEIAKESLARTIEYYSQYDFGSVLAPVVQQKLQDARTCMEISTNVEEIVECDEALNVYFENLRQSTRIDFISGGDVLRSYEICLQGNWCDAEDDDLYGYSVLHLICTGNLSLDNLEIELSSENASYQWADSDKEGYQKMLLVTNSETQAVEKYYVEQTEYVPIMYPYEVIEEGNYFTQYYYSSSDTEGFDGIFYVCGENETLVNPVFEYYDSNVTGEYSAVGETSEMPNGYVGNLTTTYNGTQKKYMVIYIQQIRSLYLNGITEEGNTLEVDGYNGFYLYDEDDNETYYKVYDVEGVNENLGSNPSFSFNGVTPESVTCVAEAGEHYGIDWTHKLTIVYKGVTVIMYLDYQQSEM